VPSDVLPASAPIVAEVTRMLVAVIGADQLLDLEITPDSAFHGDLGLESIELVALGGRLQERYGRSVDFVGYVSSLGIEAIMELTLGQLAAYITDCLAADARG
jgi:acyl carrier protein